MLHNDQAEVERDFRSKTVFIKKTYGMVATKPYTKNLEHKLSELRQNKNGTKRESYNKLLPKITWRMFSRTPMYVQVVQSEIRKQDI